MKHTLIWLVPSIFKPYNQAARLVAGIATLVLGLALILGLLFDYTAVMLALQRARLA